MPTAEGKQTIAEALTALGTPLPFTTKKTRKKKLPPFQKASSTSLDAAISMIDHTESLQTQVYMLLLRAGPLTDEGIAVALNLNPSTERPRRIELVKSGKVIEVGEGTTKSGRRAILWGVTAMGEE